MHQGRYWNALLTLVASASLHACAHGHVENGDRASNRAASAPTEGAWAGYVQKFDAYVRDTHTVGASTLLLRNGVVTSHHETGAGDRELRQPIDANSIFQYGSITKTLTAITVMQLRDRGKLSLEDAVTRYVPELRRVNDSHGWVDRITIRMLLDHSAGFQVATWPWKQGQSWEPFEPTAWEQLVSMLPYQQLAFEPGSRYSYSNPGYIYLARVVEAVTGESWLTYVQKNVFAPLGMTRSYFSATPYYLAEHRSNNYTVVRAANGQLQTRANDRDFDPGITNPNGGWNAPLGDVAKYLAFLTAPVNMGSDMQRTYEIVLKRSTLEEMWQPQLRIASRPSPEPSRDLVRKQVDHIGLSFFIQRRGSRKILGHTGSQAGFHAFLYFDPAAHAGIIAVFNTANGVTSDDALFELREAAIGLLQ